MMPKVSVIIAIYNIQEYVQQCIESVIRQTLQDIEIILIDDGSTDDSGSICDEYATQDKRIKVVHKTNEGLSSARNDGIDISTAPYIMFVDGDDWVDPKFCELPYSVALEQKVDMVIFGHNSIFSHDQAIDNSNAMHEGILSESEALYNNIFNSNAAWLALYRRELFDNNRFPAGKLYEDVGVIHRLIHEANSWYYIREALYSHRIGRRGSITTDPNTRNHKDFRDMFVIRVSDLLDWGYEEYAQKLALSMVIKFGSREKYFVDVVKEANVLRSDSLKQRLVYRIIKFSPTLFDAICFITGRRKIT